ncbi:MAG TPA: hypothetical protein VIL36_02215 [Acidimicrobiales bacterium]
MRPPRLAAAVGAAVLALTAFAAVSLPTPAGAAPTAACPPGQVPQRSSTRGPAGKRVTITVCVPGSSTPGGTPPGGHGRPSGGGDDDGNYTVCVPWEEAYPGHDPTGINQGEPGERAYLCIPYRDGRPVYGPYIPTWLGPGEEPPPSPAEVAADIWADVSGDLLDPEIAAFPAEGTPALIDVPTFVSVTNWQGEFTASDCDAATGTVCVSLTATPALTFDPGDGTGEIACEPGGTAYDPAGGTPQEQAARDGACAHAYTRRTGVAGRPEAWEATVSVTWSVSWAGAGQSGTLDPIALPYTFLREVQEVQSVGRDG